MTGRDRSWAGALCAGLILAGVCGAQAAPYKETPMFAEAVAAGKLPPVEERLPDTPAVVNLEAMGRTIGKPGGELRTLIGPPKDTKLLVVYGYARLVGYDHEFNLVPDIALSYEVEDDRVFTFKLRKGHKWSNGDPFTAEDFRYYWEDVANNRELSPSGPPRSMLVDGKPPKFEVIDETTVRYTWDSPNPFFLAKLAGAAPLFIYRPSTYMKQYHKKYADPEKIKALIEKARMRSWAPLHNRLDNMYKFNNPDLPTLQPWRVRTKPPANRFIGERNPYFHRVDTAGQQLPYIDRVVLISSDTRLVPAKAGSGEVDLQARGLAFKDYAFLKQNEDRFDFDVYLWSTAKGSQMALFPNFNTNDEVWRTLLRDVRFRRALSLGIDREIINEALYFGLAAEGNNTILPQSPLYDDAYRETWAVYDPDKANELLDEIGLTERNDDDLRVLPDGRPMEILVETAGEDTEQTDILELIRETWAELGIKLISNPSQRQVFRNRIFSGESVMSVWGGLENGVVTADMSPAELAPTSQLGLQWPKWGQHYETSGQAGEPPDMEAGKRLAELNDQWVHAKTRDERAAIWHKMLEIHAEKQLTIGVVSQVKQPIVVHDRVHNVPKEGVYNWDPGAQFGCYRPDTFWLDPKQ